MNKFNKKYDVVILTYKPKYDLVLSIEKLLSQKILPQKILICNTEKNLFYENIKEKTYFENILNNDIIEIMHIDKKDFDHGKTRNEASKRLNSPYILFMTDDAIPYDEYFAENLLNSFDCDGVAVSYARQIAKDDAKLKEKYVREFNYPDYNIIKDKLTEKKYGIKNCFCSNSSAMYDRKVFDKYNGFEVGLTQNEDMLYAYKIIDAGYKVCYVSNAKVYHSHNFSYMEQYKRNYAIGVFQQTHKNIYDRFSSEGEGKKMVKEVVMKLLKGGHFMQVIDFIIDCAFRLIGFKNGKKSV